MSWDAYLIDDRGHIDGEWNYTHNTNCMANEALYEGVLTERVAVKAEVKKYLKSENLPSWWKVLNGKEGPAGAAMLHVIIQRMEADPEKFRDMNPPNGWGDYDSFLEVLREMRDSVPEWPTRWEVGG